ncbi:MAG TPA: GGDEF domain-containing protein [Flavisolibacter sp.]|nr:GGDEF domain-containing protein [Flavisolibacter sp.]
MSYLKKSLDKFRQDALSKLFYDLLKWLLLTILAFAATKLLPGTTSIGEFLTKKATLSIYSIFLIGLGIIGLTVLIVSILFNKKYQVVRNDNFTDELTGLKNHKAFHKYINNKVTGDRTFSIIMIDVDDFKRFNTDYSPNTADKILGKLGELLGNDKRATDETFRQFLRGDEFVVIANDTNLNDAIKAAERKRGLIANTTFVIDEKPFKLTVSCGVTEFKKGKDDFSTLTNRVNQALVEAKGITGKNNTRSII